jgi:hypothetical protein
VGSLIPFGILHQPPPQPRYNWQRLATPTVDAVIHKRAEHVDYPEFEAILGALHAAGFFPEGNLVSAVAQALIRP